MVYTIDRVGIVCSSIALNRINKPNMSTVQQDANFNVMNAYRFDVDNSPLIKVLIQLPSQACSFHGVLNWLPFLQSKNYNGTLSRLLRPCLADIEKLVRSNHNAMHQVEMRVEPFLLEQDNSTVADQHNYGNILQLASSHEQDKGT